MCLYAGNALGNCTNITITGNKFTTRYWVNGGNFGPATDIPAFGSNGNVTGGNVWADDYGTGRSGRVHAASPPASTRPANGPRAGTTVL